MPSLIVSNQRTEEMIGDLSALPLSYRRYVAGQAQRMAWIAEAGDVIVLPVMLDGLFLDYVTDLLGLARGDVHVIAPPSGALGPDVLSRDRLENPRFLAETRHLIAERHVDRILPWHSDGIVVGIARSFGLDAATPGMGFFGQGGVGLVNSKATFRAIAAGVGLPIADGVVTADRTAAREFVWELLAHGKCAILKQDYHVGGIGNELISPVEGVRPDGADRIEVITDRASLAAHLDDRWDWYTDLGRHRLVIEHYIPNSVPIYSELVVGADGAELVGYGEMRMQPVINGLIVPAPSAELAEFSDFLTASVRLGGALGAIGYRGRMSVDAIVTPDNRILINEVNGRIVGSTHVHAIGERIVGGDYLADRVLLEKRRCPLPRDFRILHDRLVEYGIDYDARERRGVVITVFDGREGGYGGCCIVGESLADAEKIETVMTEALDPLVAAA